MSNASDDRYQKHVEQCRAEGVEPMARWEFDDPFYVDLWCRQREQDAQARLLLWLLAIALPIAALLIFLEEMGVLSK